jgi:fructoselysine 6-kinase
MKSACFSIATIDYYSQQNKTYPGGNSLIQAICFRNLGFESAFIGALGTDPAGDQIAALMLKKGVDLSLLQRISGQTASNEIVVDETGEPTSVEATWQGGVCETFQLSETDWKTISSFDVWSTHADGANYAAALAHKQRGQLMSVDFQHLKDSALLEKSLRVVDIAFFSGAMDMADDLALLAKNNRSIIVLTLGAQGSMAFEGDHTFTQAALPMGKIIDITGYSDAFQAAFTARYYRSRDIRAALFAGVEMGRKAAGHFGGTEWK